MRRAHLTALATSLLAVALLAPTASADQATVDSITEAIARDVTALSVNTPIWLARHLPATMAQTGLGAGIGISDEGGGFAIGVMPLRVGFFNQFSQVGAGTDLIDFETALPGNLPWLQFGASLGVGLGKGFEIGADVQFIPNMDVGFGDDVSANVGLFSLAGAVRWRLNKAHGAVPAVVIGVGGSYYRGTIKLGANFSSSYSTNVDNGFGGTSTVEGTYTFEGAPQVEWSLWQVGPEVRVAWDWGPVHPYLGFGLGFTFGDVTGGARLRAEATIDKVDGQAVTEDNAVFQEFGDIYSTDPARYLMRPHIGIDFVFGPVAITTQVDLAVMNERKIGGDLGEAAGSFDPTSDEGFLYNESSKSSQTAAALVLSLGLRFQL